VNDTRTAETMARRPRLTRKRLLSVARALRESPEPGSFSMSWYVTDCGTPMCALGHYASRPDLQDFLSLKKGSRYLRVGKGLLGGIDDPRLLRHFGLRDAQSRELFNPRGCGDARTTTQAADYIERFVRLNP